jgi:hypothetical protein
LARAPEPEIVIVQFMDRLAHLLNSPDQPSRVRGVRATININLTKG